MSRCYIRDSLCVLFVIALGFLGCKRRTYPLTQAIARGNYQTAKALLKSGANPNERDALGSTPLWSAVYSDDTQLVNLLFAYGANVVDTFGESQSIGGVLAGRDSWHSLPILVAHGLPIEEAVNSKGSTMLDVAAGSRSMHVASWLLAHHANPNAVDSFGFSPLFNSIGKGDTAMVALLLNGGANPNLRKPLNTPLLFDVLDFSDTLIRYQRQLRRIDSLYPVGRERRIKADAIVKLLLSAGADPNVAKSNGETPLYIAARLCDSTVVELLIRRGANPNERLSSGESPLDVAKKNNCKAVIKLLGGE